MRKRAYDCGAYILLVQIATMLARKSEGASEIKHFIEAKFFNLLEMHDLEYNLRLIKAA